MFATKRAVCPFDCPDTCSVLVADDGRSCRGDPADPYTRGFLCAKGRRYPELVFSPDRLLTPLKRVGPKGSAIFRPVSWEEALAEIAARLEETLTRWGGASILPYASSGTLGAIQGRAGDPFFNALGALSLADTICSAAGEVGWEATLGRRLGTDPETAVDCDLILIWGANPASTRQHFVPLLQEARRRGARVVLVDPYASRTARLADRRLCPRPGTDTALALGLMHVLWREDLLDHAYLERHTVGFSELARRVLPRYTPEQTAGITGVLAEEIVALARTYAAAQAPFLLIGYGLSRQRGAGQLFRALACLPALVGAYGRKRGGALFSTSQGFPLDRSAVHRVDLRPVPARVVNMLELGKALGAMAEQPVRLLFVYNANPAATCPDQNSVRAGLARDDLFTVVLEQFPTETTAYADIILPATTAWEHADLYSAYGHYYLKWAEAVLPPRAAARSNLAVFQELAGRLGLKDPVFSLTTRQWAEQVVRRGPGGLSDDQWAALWRGEPVRVLPRGANPFAHGFPTPSGKLEIYSATLAAQGLPPLPDYQEDEPSADADTLHLITAHPHDFINSSLVPPARARGGGKRPVLVLNPADAAARGLKDGDLVRAKSGQGEVDLPLAVSAAIRPGAAYIQGLVDPTSAPGWSVNFLTSQRLSDFGGGSTFSDSRIKVSKAGERGGDAGGDH
ncbi:MAG TPA: molybdopterin-dependent oxidoreductase [Firmicutes bacterium]|nr:molybdopterin-dependent oxidoreductase [Bacillota bacterium]